MFANLHSATIFGIDAQLLDIEIDTSSSHFAGMVIVGLPDAGIKESRERITTSIRNSEYAVPPRKIVVNLAPADIRKEGTAFDLPIALGILMASDQIRSTMHNDYVVLGELALDGKVRPVRGALCAAIAAREHGKRGVILPRANAAEAAVVKDIEVLPTESLAHAAGLLTGDQAPERASVNINDLFEKLNKYEEDFADVKGQEAAKRSLTIAAAGGHNALLIGPAGSGKTMLTRRLPTILPKLTFEEALETTKIHSVAGMLGANEALLVNRPFRAPHYTISAPGLVGGGTIPRPGEISLAHNGVLFLDELPETPRNILENLRQPLEDGIVTISRATGSLTFPSRVMLVGAMNPCPCGAHGDPRGECRCSPREVQRYISRISGPLLDRLDLHVEVPSLEYRELADRTPGENSASIRERVTRARALQTERFRNAGIHTNAQMTPKMVKEFCGLSSESAGLLQEAIEELGLSARAYDKIHKVARTVADLECAGSIELPHISEAIQYRSLDRRML